MVHDDALAVDQDHRVAGRFAAPRHLVAAQRQRIGDPAQQTFAGVFTLRGQLQAEVLRAQGASVMHLAVGTTLVGLLAVSDPIKAMTDQKASGSRSEYWSIDGMPTANGG